MNARDELIELLHQEATADRVKNSPLRDVPVVAAKLAASADAILAAGYRKQLTIENDKLVIDDGLLLLEVGSCTCSPYGSSHEHGCGYEYLDDLTKPLARAGYRRPRVVTTVAELDALPVGAIVLDSDPDALLKTDNGWRSLIDPDEPFKSLYLSLPATVLHEPEAS